MNHITAKMSSTGEIRIYGSMLNYSWPIHDATMWTKVVSIELLLLHLLLGVDTWDAYGEILRVQCRTTNVL